MQKYDIWIETTVVTQNEIKPSYPDIVCPYGKSPGAQVKNWIHKVYLEVLGSLWPFGPLHPRTRQAHGLLGAFGQNKPRAGANYDVTN